jgi:nicotinate-nucleotide pyrophosphorylase (carboxylating)
MVAPSTIELLVAELSNDRYFDDVTGKLLGSEKIPCQALVRAKQAGIFSGVEIGNAIAEIFLGAVEVVTLKAEGDAFLEGDTIVRLTGAAQTCLAVERTLVNTLSHLSGVATLTRKYVEAVAGSGIRVLATRKTLPGLRHLQLQAVLAGGGYIHRRSLSDGILIKENHLMFASESQLISNAKNKRSPLHRIEIEVQNLDQLTQVLQNPPDIILLDNLEDDQLRTALLQIDGKCQVEVSGGVSLERLPSLAKLGVDYISVGRLTHSASAIDLSMDFLPGV